MNKNQFKCAWCNGVFDLVRDDTWSEEKANAEYDKLFPGASYQNRDVVCDDCWKEFNIIIQEVRPDYKSRA